VVFFSMLTRQRVGKERKLLSLDSSEQRSNGPIEGNEGKKSVWKRKKIYIYHRYVSLFYGVHAGPKEYFVVVVVVVVIRGSI
jgi:hypothetical protein